MSYRVELRPAAVRALKNIDPQNQARIRAAIELLAINPRPPKSQKLQGRPELRVCVGDYRILYSVHDDVLLVLVLSLGHRREA
ncbi:MAG: type II toxin-antitoxin system RelE/ParE family toxin [Microbacteriaceae bacterium]